VIAALVIFSGGGEHAPKPEARAPVRAGDQSLVVGKEEAAAKVVIYEDFAGTASRELEIATRDFLRIEAARGVAQVEYRPFVADDDAYSRDAMAAWAGVLDAGTPNQALTFHDVLFDRQPEPGLPAEHDFLAWAKDAGLDDVKVLDAIGTSDEGVTTEANRAAADAGVSKAPVVLVDGDPLTAGSPTELADKLQRLLLKKE
jgi:protein-disulfide isomerase